MINRLHPEDEPLVRRILRQSGIVLLVAAIVVHAILVMKHLTQ